MCKDAVLFLSCDKNKFKNQGPWKHARMPSIVKWRAIISRHLASYLSLIMDKPFSHTLQDAYLGRTPTTLFKNAIKAISNCQTMYNGYFSFARGSALMDFSYCNWDLKGPNLTDIWSAHLRLFPRKSSYLEIEIALIWNNITSIHNSTSGATMFDSLQNHFLSDMRTVDTCLDTHQSLKMGIKKSSRPSYKMTMIIMNQKQLSIAKRQIPIILCQNQRRELFSILYFRVQGFKQESKQLWSWSWQTTVDCLNQYQLLT